GGDDLRRFSWADVCLGEQLCEGSATERVNALELGEQTRGQGDYVFAPAAGAQQDGEKLGIREGVRSARPQAFARPLVGRHFANQGMILGGGASHTSAVSLSRPCGLPKGEMAQRIAAGIEPSVAERLQASTGLAGRRLVLH